MTPKESIDAVRSGGRAVSEHSLHSSENTSISVTCDHRWRVIVCHDDTDVIECYSCGQQKITNCTFDDEYA